MADLFSEDLTHNFLFSHPKFSPKTITLWKIPSHIDYFEEFQDQKVAYYHSHLLDRTDCPKHHLKNDFRGKTKTNKRFLKIRKHGIYVVLRNSSLLPSTISLRKSWAPATLHQSGCQMARPTVLKCHWGRAADGQTGGSGK